MIGSQVREARIQRGWSQARLAEAAGVTQPTIHRVESSDPGISARTLTAISSALGVRLVWTFDPDEGSALRRVCIPPRAGGGE